MPLWGILFLVFLVFAAAAGASYWYFISGVLAALVGGAYLPFAATKAAGLVLFCLALLAVLLFLLARWIVVPVRRLARAIQAFAADGTRIPINLPTGSPREIRALVASFAGLLSRVEEAHKRDLEISRVKSDFISTAAHQLRTPLTGIRWALEALLASNPTEDQRALIGSAGDKSRELVDIVGTLLDISAIESGKYRYQFAPTDLSGLLDEMVRDFAPLAAEHQVALRHVPSLPAPPARADRERVKWVLNNLIENAIHYTPAGGSVDLAIDLGPNVLFVRVRDTGIGILPEDRGNIFERFFRGQNAVSKENEGNGLGLYIARTIATDHGGDLTFASNGNDPGTTFTLSLPLWR